MPLIKDGRFVADPWRHLGDDEPVAAAARVSVSDRRWRAERAELLDSGAALGVRLANDAALQSLAPDLDRIGLVILSFPRFTDGRAYSQARLLRGRLGYRGELRAQGEVLRDQLLFMQRCGFDAWVVPERAEAENWLAAFAEFDVFYQPAEDRRPWLMRLRHAPA
ncbi:MAG TPA: DUF934 domain-containing protein [Stellaceae bacterium]|nr:DUF934 domain-containing protein [Stellaceae bacterium]